MTLRVLLAAGKSDLLAKINTFPAANGSSRFSRAERIVEKNPSLASHFEPCSLRTGGGGDRAASLIPSQCLETGFHVSRRGHAHWVTAHGFHGRREFSTTSTATASWPGRKLQEPTALPDLRIAGRGKRTVCK
jgi:hypothetical protein